ncbi:MULTISPECIES: hypothetical protein [unclassified Sinorhizobium]|uniref:GH39 family glycosyl hydrolase n=1 Tax=unclassified Sinorhizobium TaxID=2613772 RepID=UPI00352693B3
MMLQRILTMALAATLLMHNSVIAGEADKSSEVPFFGVASHFLHTSRFDKKKDDSWAANRTLPLIENLGTVWIAEAIYSYARRDRALIDDGSLNATERAQMVQRRQLVDYWLSLYDRNHRKVILPILASPPKAKNYEYLNIEYTRYINQLIKSHPSIVAVQLHNEPNLRVFWNGTAEDYVSVYRKIAQDIKKENPRVKIIVGGIASLSWPNAKAWFNRALDAGLLDFADGVSVHPYSTGKPPEVDPHLPPANDFGQRQRAIGAFWKDVQKYNKDGRPLQLYFTEFGYSSSKEGLNAVGSELLKAKYLSRTLALFADVRIRQIAPLEAVFWYDFKDDGIDPDAQEHNFGLVSADLRTKKPSFDFYQRTIAALGDIGDLEPTSETFGSRAAAPFVLLQWKRKSTGEYILPFWSPKDQDADIEVSIPKSINLQSQQARIIDIASGTTQTIDITDLNSNRMLHVTAKDSLSILVLN